MDKLGPSFFIVGSQRSGTTLLRLMLNAHSDIAIPEEGGFWMPLLRDCRKQGTYIQSDPQFHLWKLDPVSLFDELRGRDTVHLRDLMGVAYSRFALAGGKRISGDKTPSFFRMISILADLFPEARFIHLFRDGRDIYLSRRKYNPAMGNVSVQALEWVHKVRKIRLDLHHLDPSRFMELRYEDLVAAPSQKLKSICLFLGLSYEPRMLEYWKSSSDFIGRHHSTLIFRPVSNDSVEKWKREMTSSALRKFDLIAGKDLVACGYRLSSENKPAFRELAGVGLDLATGLPIRASKVFLTALNMHLSVRHGVRLFQEKVGEYPEGHSKHKKTPV